MIRRIFLFAWLLLAAGAACASDLRVTPQDSGVAVRLRGISAVDANVAWASGREGTVLRTIDGGAHWQAMRVPGASDLDFRDIEGFDADTAVVLSIGPGDASRVYRTSDGGKTWTLALQNTDPKAFFDCMAFDGQRGWMLGDPVNGRFQVYTTIDGGRAWALSSKGPKAEAGEAAFAASGTCIARIGTATVFGTGGKVSRLHYLFDDIPGWDEDDNPQWGAVDSRLGQGVESAGVFSVATKSRAPDVLIVGGDFLEEKRPAAATIFARTVGHDYGVIDRQGRDPTGSKTGYGFRARTHRQPAKTPGYRSGVACSTGNGAEVCIAVGPTGVDALIAGKWRPLTDIGYDAIDLAGDVGWTSGDAGRIARVDITAD